jgi:tight adherence protein B
MSLVSLFLILLLALSAVVFLLTEPSKTEKALTERLGTLASRRTQDSAGGISTEDILARVTFSSIPWIDEHLRRNKRASDLYVLFQQADLRWTVGRFLFATLAMIAAAALIGTHVIGEGLAGWAPGLVLGPVPYAYVRYKRSKRFHKFERLLPEAIDLISRALRAGHSIPAAVEIVANEVREPLGPEFKRAAEEQNFGLPFREAMLNLVSRMPVPDLQFLVTAILVQKETGGNLAEVLDKTSAVLRDRLRLAGQLRIHTAQGKLTGTILAVLPVGCFLALSLLHPGYESAFIHDPTGQKLIFGAVVLMIFGGLLIRKIVTVKV